MPLKSPIGENLFHFVLTMNYNCCHPWIFSLWLLENTLLGFGSSRIHGCIENIPLSCFQTTNSGKQSPLKYMTLSALMPSLTKVYTSSSWVALLAVLAQSELLVYGFRENETKREDPQKQTRPKKTKNVPTSTLAFHWGFSCPPWNKKN